MFAATYGIVRDYARPVILSQPEKREVFGCGTFIVVNSAGWILTAKHVMEAARRGSDDRGPTWGWKGTAIDDVVLDSDSDMALGKLEPFDVDWVAGYPSFRDPEGIGLGTSVGRLGYTASVEGDVASASVSMNAGVVSKDYVESGVRYMVTSSAGFKGQSGGPVFDLDGAVCGMQVSTRVTALGHTRMTPLGEAVQLTTTEGVAIHVASLMKFMDAAGIAYLIKNRFSR